MKLIKENIPFTMVANEVLYNKNLSFKTKGLYAYLFSKPDTWDFSSSRMVLETKDSRDSIMVMLRELETAGYLMRKRLSTGKVEYTLIFSHNSLSREMPLGVEKPKSEIAYVAKSLRGESLPISNIEEKVISKDSNNSKAVALQGKEIGFLLKEFETINPMISSLYGNTTERSALEEMAKSIGYEKLLATIKALPEIVCQPFAPKITKPTELKRDFGKLLLFVKQHKLQVGKYQAKSIQI
jgi:hypothetical protein